MKVLLLSDANSIHTIKWARSLAEKGIQMGIFSLNQSTAQHYEDLDNITAYCVHDENTNKRTSGFCKISYLKALPYLKKVISEFKPDIVHAHYATSYGLLGALANFHPYIVSVWGSDVFDFPHTSIVHKLVLKYNLSCADKILSTSKVMAKETKLYTSKEVEVTPFGIDLNVFKPMKVENVFEENSIVIGTVKSLEEKYGIEYLIRAFAILKHKYSELPLKLLIVGDGGLRATLEDLSRELKIDDVTNFTGKISHEEVPIYDNMLSIYVALSNMESFGVAVIEASACGKPVIVSRIGGLQEVEEDGITGIVVPPRNPEATACAIEKLIINPKLIENMGKAGRERVEKLYDWNENVEQMIEIYTEILN